VASSPDVWAAPPRPPILPDVTAAAVDLAELDELYPDVDGLEAADVVLALPEARTLDLLRSRLRGCTLDLPPECAVEAGDSVLDGMDLAGRRITGLVRTHLVRCRLSGADLAEATLEDVTFEDCALDLASWRLARIRRVAVVGGRIDGLDATAAQLSDLTIEGVGLEEVLLERARCERVDLTGADLTSVTDVAGLAGATISPSQAVALAARMARGLGVRVHDPGDRPGAFPPLRDRK
jgi:uncharacterized protein YjbI with pentapeptide repeats